MSRRSARQEYATPQEPMINITPLIDVVFVILIAFIVIAPLLELDRIALARGSHTTSPVHMQDASSIQIHVYADNTIAINQQKIPLEQLSKALHDAKMHFPKARPQLFHDKKAYFGTYQTVKNIIEASGFPEMDVVLSPS
jgi:biopolymer transport protein ExbD